MISILQLLIRHRWLASFLFWQVSAIVFISHRFFTALMDTGSAVNWGSYIASMEALHLAWTILTVPVFSWLSGKNFQSISTWIFIPIVLAAIHSLLTTGLYAVALIVVPGHFGYDELQWAERIQRLLVTSPVISWVIAELVIAAWYAGTVAVRYEEERRKSTQLKAQLTESQLQVLRMQLNPHFIFNAFNTISMMIRSNRSAEANDMLAKLSGLFRGSLMKATNALITLQEELDFCREYLEIEAIRFSDRLKIDIDIPADAMKLSLPNMILQPLIENAFKHGLTNVLDDAPSLRISANVGGHETWNIEVANTGRLNKEQNESGVGLKNVRERLKLYYGEKASFSLTENGSFVVARLTIPK